MKVVPFTIPIPDGTTIHVQQDRMPHLYRHLHRHREIQLTLIREGSGTLLAGNEMLPFEPGDIFMLGAHLPHVFKNHPAYFSKNHEGFAAADSVFFDPSGPMKQVLLLPELSGLLNWLQRLPEGCRIAASDSAACTGAFEKVIRATGAERLSHLLILMEKMASSNFLPFSPLPKRMLSETDGQRINLVIQYTMQHLSEAVTIADAAGQIHMTPPAFCRYFKKHTRKTFITFLNELRIREACRLLQQGRWAGISAIAWETGFTNISHFNRVFRKVMQLSPSDYLKSFYQTSVNDQDFGT